MDAEVRAAALDEKVGVSMIAKTAVTVSKYRDSEPVYAPSYGRLSSLCAWFVDCHGVYVAAVTWIGER